MVQRNSGNQRAAGEAHPNGTRASAFRAGVGRFDAAAFSRLAGPFDWRITGKWMLFSALIGVAAALGALAFASLLDGITHLSFDRLLGYHPPVPGSEGGTPGAFDLASAFAVAHPWLLLVIPTLGGLLSGLIVYRYAPEAEGHGTDAVIRSFHHQGGHIRPRVPLVKTVASALTIGTGGSAGREGPIAQIGAGFGSYLATRLRLGDRDRRLFLVAGMAAGIGAIFQSPLGGAFFAVEVLYREDIESAALMPAVIAGVMGYSVYSGIVGSSTIFATPTFAFGSPLELLPLIALAPVCGIVGIFYVRLFYGIKGRLFGRLPIRPWLKPALGGLGVGALALVVPPILGSSYGWLQEAILGNLPVGLMLAIIPAKILATSLTIGSGGSGGVFAPSLVIGGMLGGVFGSVVHAVLPSLVHQPSAYVLIGMATFFAGAANVPIATTIMICEMTGSYTLLIPLIFSGVTVHLMSRRWSLYTQQLRTHADSPAHGADLRGIPATDITAGELLATREPVPCLGPGSRLDEIMDTFARTRWGVLPVGEAAEPAGGSGWTGLVYLEEIQSLLRSDRTTQRLIIARDLECAFTAIPATAPLGEALAAFERTGRTELPVVDAQQRIVGILAEADASREFRRALVASLRVSASAGP